MEKVKRHLWSYQRLRDRIQFEEEKFFEEYRNTLEQVAVLKAGLILPSVASDGMPHASGATKDRMAEVFAEIDEILRKCRSRIDELVDQRAQAQKIMNNIISEIEEVEDSGCRVLLFYRYIIGLKWEEIAEKLKVNEDYCRNGLHYKALEEFKKVTKSNIK